MSLSDINMEDVSAVKIVLLSVRFGQPLEDDSFDRVEEALAAGAGMIDWNTAAPCAVVVDGVIRYTRTGNRIDGYNGVWHTPSCEADLEFAKKHWPKTLVKEITDG